MVKMAKKFLFVLTLIFAFSFSAGAFGATELVVRNGGKLTTSNFQDEVIDPSADITQHTLANKPYEFSSINDALNFANNPQDYIDKRFPSTDSDDYKVGEDDFSNIEIKLENGIAGGTVKLSDYGSLPATLTITGNSQTISETISVDQRYFVLDKSGITVSINNLTLNGRESFGGINISNGTVSLTGVTFTNCTSDNGGAIYTSNGTITVDGCTFNTNTATADGGAMCIAGGTLTFTNSNIFTSNTAATNGGAVAVKSGSVTFPSGTEFTTNNAVYGGALYSSTTGTLTVDADVTFTNNTATNGATIYIAKGTANINSDITGVNITTKTTNGGAVYVYDGTVNINGNLNTNIVSGDGGAIYVAGGTANVYGSLK
ncbi:MAG: hypothetical protein IJP96_06045, partial [Synergistaceae bacterium]|nr:hypothetical protein [Synergistaceae bacterium]